MDVNDNEYHYIVAGQNATGMFLFLDGVLIDHNDNTDSISYILGDMIEIGRHGNHGSGYNFTGIIDEVRLSQIGHSADWIATEYNNQNKSSSFYSIGAEVQLKIDATPPTYLYLIESADPLELGNTEIITINVTDLYGIHRVLIEIGGVNYSMVNSDGNKWQYSWIPSSVGTYPYTIYMEDNYDNWNSTSGSIQVVGTSASISPGGGDGNGGGGSSTGVQDDAIPTEEVPILMIVLIIGSIGGVLGVCGIFVVKRSGSVKFKAIEIERIERIIGLRTIEIERIENIIGEN